MSGDQGQAKTMEHWKQWHGCEDKGAYKPEPEDIAAECEKIQATWTDAERKRRLGVYNPLEVETAVVNTSIRKGSEYLIQPWD